MCFSQTEEKTVYFRGIYIGSQTHFNVFKIWRDNHGKERISNDKKYNSKLIRKFIKDNLINGYSPQIIPGLLRNKYDILIHFETIYKYIYKTNSKLNLAKYLLRRKLGRKPRKRLLIKPMKSMMPNRLDITLRPISTNLRNEFGHFEADSIEGIRAKNVIVNSNNNNRQKRDIYLTVLVDRKTRLTKVKKTASKTSIQTNASILKALKSYSNTIKSITYDNGCEFSRHEEINK